MTYFLILTAISVSVDSLFCGFSLCASEKKKFQIVLGVALTVFIMCVIANYLAVFLKEILTEKTASFGGIILIALGLYNLLFKREPKSRQNGVLKQSIICGFAVGLDGATANLSLSLMGLNGFFVPLFIAFCHAVMLGLGAFLSKFTKGKKAQKFAFIPPLVLIGLGIYKLTAIFY